MSTVVDWGLEHTGWTAAQVVSELATNCTLHARSEFTVRVLLEGGCVRLEVEDHSPAPLQSRLPSATATTGRGLAIVDVLAVEWGVTSHTHGKTVWVVLAVDGADRLPSEDDEERPSSAGATRGSVPSGTRAATDGSPAAA